MDHPAPVDLRPFEDAEPLSRLLSPQVRPVRRYHRLGQKSAVSTFSSALLAACQDAVIWAIDLKKTWNSNPEHLASTALDLDGENSNCLIN